jgi:hypothetical protein
VATQRTTMRGVRRAFTLSTTMPETETAVDGLRSAAPRSAAKGSDDTVSMGGDSSCRLFRRTRSRVVGAAGEGKNGKCRGEREERLMFAWVWRDGIFLIQVGLCRFLGRYEVAT